MLKDLKKITAPSIENSKGKEQIACLTAYDYQMAYILDKAGIDVLLVGDSLEMVFMGSENTLTASIDQMIYHTKAVKKATERSLVVTDMPFGSYHISDEEALTNAIKIIREGGSDAVKVEGGIRMEKTIKKIVNAEIPVLGHIGLTPQSIHRIGGYKRQKARQMLIDDAKAVEEAGSFAVVLEMVDEGIAEEISDLIKIPTIGIGSGNKCDGQILVINDALGFLSEKPPSFAKQYANLSESIKNAALSYITDIKAL